MTCAKQQLFQYRSRGILAMHSDPKNEMLNAANKRDAFYSGEVNSLGYIDPQRNMSCNHDQRHQHKPLLSKIDYSGSLELYPIHTVPSIDQKKSGSNNYHRNLISQSMYILKQLKGAQRERQRYAALVIEQGKLNGIDNHNPTHAPREAPGSSLEIPMINQHQVYTNKFIDFNRNNGFSREILFRKLERSKCREGLSLRTDQAAFKCFGESHRWRRSHLINTISERESNQNLDLPSLKNGAERRAPFSKIIPQSSIAGDSHQSVFSEASLQKKQRMHGNNPTKISTRSAFSHLRLSTSCLNSDTHRTLIRESTRNDVIIARGREASDFAGNIQFQGIVAKYQAEFANLSPYSRKRGFIARRIIDDVRNKSPPGRFLKEDALSGLWYETGQEEAIKMAMITLRSHSRKIKKEASSSDQIINQSSSQISVNEQMNRSYRNIKDSEIAQDLLSLANISGSNLNVEHHASA